MKETYLVLRKMRSEILNVDSTLQTMMEELRKGGKFDFDSENETQVVMRGDVQLLY